VSCARVPESAGPIGRRSVTAGSRTLPNSAVPSGALSTLAATRMAGATAS
jgi:hypothetical protein